MKNFPQWSALIAAAMIIVLASISFGPGGLLSVISGNEDSAEVAQSWEIDTATDRPRESYPVEEMLSVQAHSFNENDYPAERR